MALHVVSHSALEYWRWLRPSEYGFARFKNAAEKEPLSHELVRVENQKPDGSIANDAEIQEALRTALCGLSTPLNLAVSTREGRSRSALKIAHLCTSRLPKGSFAQVADNVYVSTPEYLFVQMGTSLTFEEHVWLGHELCNRYILDRALDSCTPARPLTCKKLLEDYVHRAATMRGAQAAKKALLYVVEDAASPMESVVVILLCLPLKYGGYGLPLPIMNGWIRINNRTKHQVGQDEFACDLLWPNAHLALEYDGRDYHTGIDRITHDNERRNDLQHLGYAVFSLTKLQLNDFASFDRTARQIAKHLGIRLRTDQCRYDWAARNLELRSHLLPSGLTV